MAVLCYILSILFLALITIQDFRERMVYWILFPLAAISLGLYAHLDYLNSGRDILINFLYILFVGFFLVGYMLFKKYRIENILKKFLGLGDMLFFGVIAVALPSVVFALFFLLSLLLSLGLGLTALKGSTIPLAGCQSVLLGVLISMFHFNIMSVWDIEKLIMP